MFGYVRPFVPEMKVSEYEQYRAIYCGMCREIGRTSGQLSRFALSYDIVLFCSVRMVLDGIFPEYERVRCFAHPTKKRLVLKPNAATKFTASVFSALVSSNIADDLSDEHGIRKLRPLALAPLAAHLRNVARDNLPDGTSEKVEELLARLTALENEKCPSADDAASAFGEVLALLFSVGLDGENRKVAEIFGRSVGKFIYMCDAVDDLVSDEKCGRYNPLRYGWGELATDGGKVSPIIKDAVRTGTMLCLAPLEDAVEALDTAHPLTPIIKNIVYLGLDASLGKILSGKREPLNLTGNPG